MTLTAESEQLTVTPEGEQKYGTDYYAKLMAEAQAEKAAEADGEQEGNLEAAQEGMANVEAATSQLVESADNLGLMVAIVGAWKLAKERIEGLPEDQKLAVAIQAATEALTEFGDIGNLPPNAAEIIARKAIAKEEDVITAVMPDLV
jgi:hypothetical protein